MFYRNGRSSKFSFHQTLQLLVFAVSQTRGMGCFPALISTHLSRFIARLRLLRFLDSKRWTTPKLLKLIDGLPWGPDGNLPLGALAF